MPFKSEKQRRYLWANEPEIARDWTDTYGSRIEKNDGGIMRTGFFKAGLAAGDNISPGTTTGSKARDRSQKDDMRIRDYKPPSGSHHQDIHGPVDTVEVKKGRKRDQKTKTESRLRKFEKKLINNFVKSNKYKNLKLAGMYGKPGFKGLWGEILSGLNPDDEVENFDIDSIREIASRFGGNLTKTQTRGLEGLRKDLAFQEQFPNATTKDMRDYYGLDKIPQGRDDQPEWSKLGYPSYAAWQAAQGGGGETKVAEVVEETPSAFQQSLTAGANTPNYYVGENPLASNIAWGQQMGVDPRTMGLTSWAAEGGRIPAAFGGIMDTETGRRAYGIGSFFKKIGRAAKKVLKSPIGKAALLAGGAYFGPQFLGAGKAGFGQWGNVPFLRSALQKPLTTEGWHQKGGWLRKGLGKLFMGGGKYADDAWNPWKIGIGAATALPFFMGGKEEDDDPKFDYDAAKNAYANEIMRIKAGALAGTLDPNKFVYQGVKDGGRIGFDNGGFTMDDTLAEEARKVKESYKAYERYKASGGTKSYKEFMKMIGVGGLAQGGRADYYEGGQSIPSEYTIEDAMMTTTQDKLGGITDVMKQADLYRQGDVGQFYAAQGGRIGYAGGSGRPPITMGQIQAPPQMPGPQVPQTPMPAPQPNRMGGMNPMMNPMMNRPMMNPMMRGNPMMGGRRMAQEGGLMDLGGMEKDYRNDGGFVPIGEYEKKDDVPARLSKNEFVFTADAVRGAGGGDIDKGAEIMENIMKNLEQGGQISEETQGLTGAQEMFGVSERLSEVV